ncbi:MAG: 1-deoxy-D-xylulose-5-phosphate synthase [Pyramidobacter sp.]|jgi:1-deoxy-D-xylulose-5-phosphate synthase
MSVLDGISSPEDVRALPEKQIPQLISEVRRRIIDVTLKNGGHMASSLGTVELTVALLRTFDPRKDRVIFDVGHQSYAWKILTGRNAVFDTLRREGGISGFPKIDESPCDHFGTGHSSTSLSAALGYAIARDLQKERHHVAAVIGDGALINGEAFEALNHAGTLDTPVIFILNDNAMSISPRVGGMAMHLAKLSTSALYRGTKSVVKRFCRKFFRTNRVYNALERAKNNAKNLLGGGNLFNDMGLTYWGPFDGHDERRLERVFDLAKRYDGPLLIHVITKKGKGYKPAEENPVKYHGLSGASAGKTVGCTWSHATADCIEKMAERDPRCVVLTPAMAEGSSLTNFRKRFPHRFFDVGIAEEHMMTLAAGLAAGGMHPVACIYSTFLQRAVDQLVHDVALQNLPVIIAVDRAGLVGDDGETHQGLFDMNWTSVVPNLQVWSPYDQSALKKAFDAAVEARTPVLIRYARGEAPARLIESGIAVERDAFSLLAAPSRWGIVATGSACAIALAAARHAEERGLAVPSLFFLNRVSPFPDELLEFVVKRRFIVTVEEAYRRGGIGEHLAAMACERNASCVIRNLALPAQFVRQGTQEQQRRRYGLTPERILEIYEREKDEISA